MASPSADARSFLAFFMRWAQLMGWTVPDLHVRMCLWLADEKSPERVMMVFRGAAKSTLYAVYKAWRLWRNRTHRSLVWSADGPTAGMLTADVVNVLRNHPWCAGMLPPRPGAKRFWVNGARDARNASMRANGVNSNATGARADDVDFDDIEVPGNVETPEARQKLRQRISESTHIAVPGAQKTYIGTPHTHDSIYPERIAAGAAVLKIPLFAHTVRYIETKKATRYGFPHPVGPDGLYVLAGIHKGARLLVEGVDYTFKAGTLTFKAPPGSVIDICSMCAWPERFDRANIEQRRKETLTLNAWDSQYGLEAKPLGEVRLDPDRMAVYDVEPHWKRSNGQLTMWLGRARIVGASCRWDPSSGKLKSDVSAVAVCLQDDSGRRYLHRVVGLTGDIVEFAEDGKTVIGGQVHQLCDLVEQLKLPRVTIETNGIGAFSPATLKGALKQRRLVCGVAEDHSTALKAKRILEGLEPLLMTADQLWAHVSVIDGPLYEQMRDWNPAVKEQPDDYLDASAGACSEQPELVARAISPDDQAGIPAQTAADSWRPSSGVHELAMETGIVD
ncbi:MAG TPA: phage terminase large subunit [Roseateles sp.]|nr:phage terminase large subunit [Roseateles sp.]